MVICLEQGAVLHMTQLMLLPLTVSCFSKIQVGFTFWYWLTHVVPDNGPLNGCVCVCVFVCSCHYLVCLLVRCCVPVLETAIHSLCICHFFQKWSSLPVISWAVSVLFAHWTTSCWMFFIVFTALSAPEQTLLLMLLTHLYVPPSFFLFYQFL